MCVCLRVHMQFNAKVWAPLSKIRILLIFEVKTSKYNPCSKGTFKNSALFVIVKNRKIPVIVACEKV